MIQQLIQLDFFFFYITDAVLETSKKVAGFRPQGDISISRKLHKSQPYPWSEVFTSSSGKNKLIF
jgi:hypothetical protein